MILALRPIGQARSGVVKSSCSGISLQHYQNYLKMRRRALPQGSPWVVEVSDKEIYLARSYALNAYFRCLTLLGRFLAQSGPGIPGFAWALCYVDFPSPYQPILLNKV